MTKRERREQDAFAKLDAIYAQMPTVRCLGKCTIACGAVPLAAGEARRLHVTAHVRPRTIPLQLVDREADRCIYLSDQGRCTVYAVRPMICRAWGALKTLSCPHGCMPDRWLTDREFVALGEAVERAAGAAMETCRDGLMPRRTPSFLQLASLSRDHRSRSDAAMQADAERTRGLRAIFGGRIIAAIDNTRD